MMKTRMMPDKPGFYWARWLHQLNSTRDRGDECYCLGAANVWEVVLVQADGDPEDEDYLTVMVPGNAGTYPLEDFRWGEFVGGERKISGQAIGGTFDAETGDAATEDPN
jgi:hypothetical protein